MNAGPPRPRRGIGNLGRVTCGAVVLAISLTQGHPAGAATTIVSAGGDLQAALNAAQPGDVILLEAGATFSGNFVLPVKSGAEFITVRTSTPDSQLPPANDRVGPGHARRLARIVSSNSMAAMRAAPGAHHWRLQLLEFGSNAKGYGDIIMIGDGGASQTTLAQAPSDIVLDRLYIHGDPLLGQKRGVALNGRNVTIRGCHISDIKAVNQDTQAIGGWNGPGPYLIENNYLEAAGENVMFGGSTPYIDGVIADGVILRRNYLSRPLSWRGAIVDTPGGLSATASAEGGALGPGTYAYRVVARRPAGQTTIARSAASQEILATVPAGVASGSVAVQWSPVADAAEYLVYGRTPGQSMYWRVSGSSFVDTGEPGTSGAVPTSAGTRWTVKNVFELKAARNVTLEFNTFENNWEAGQAGYAIVLTPRGQAGACPWCVVENVTIQYNVIRHAAAAINVLGYDDTSPTGQTRNIVIRQNLFYDITGTTWGGNGLVLLLGNQPRDIVLDHNTIVHDGATLVYAYGGTSTALQPVYGFQYTNNIAQHNSYGLWSQYFTYGNQALANYYPGAVVVGNLLSGGSSARYPAGNYFHGDFSSQFIDFAREDYRLATTSPLVNAGTDGTNVGADIAAILAGQGGSGGVALPQQPPASPSNLRLVR